MKEIMHHYFCARKVTKQFLINAPIVNVIIGGMLWDPEDTNGGTHTGMMSSFEDFPDDTESLQ